MSKTAKILIGALAAIAVIACVAFAAIWLINRGGDEAVADPLTGTHWQVRSYYNPAEAGGMASPVAGTQLTAEFVDGNVSGSAGCNSYNAGYTVDGDSLSFSLPAVTMMFCGEPEGTMEQEAAFLTALETASSFKLETNQLHILNNSGQVVVDFIPYAPPPPPATAPPQATEPVVTPVPTQTPMPGITFTVDRNAVKAGECVNFYWKVDNVKEVYFYKEGEPWQDHGVAGEETRMECPPATTTYNLRVVLPDNSVEVQQITIYVEEVADAPQITRFTVDPPGQITLGQCVTVHWQVQGALDKITLKANDRVLWDAAPATGNYQDCPAAAGTVAYVLEAIGSGGTSYGQQNITVVEAVTATPEPTAAPEAPVIHSFSVSPNQVEAGECMGISWDVGGGATYSRILRNGAVLIDDAGYSGQQMDCLEEPGAYTYRLEAYDPANESVSQEQVGIVTQGTPENPLAGTGWQVTAIHDAEVGGIGVVLPGTSLTIAFGADGKVNGSAGCNTYSANYTANGAQLAITPPTSSSMLCTEPEGIMEQEAAFLSALASAGSFDLQGSQLQISNASGNLILDLVSQ